MRRGSSSDLPVLASGATPSTVHVIETRVVRRGGPVTRLTRGMLAVGAGLFLAASALVMVSDRFGLWERAGETAVRLKQLVVPVDWAGVDQAVLDSITTARAAALKAGADELDRLHARMIARVEADFVPWYFGYWQAQSRAVTYALDGARAFALGGPDADARLAARMADAFGERVIHPETLKLEMERIASHMADRFASVAQAELSGIEARYAIDTAALSRRLDALGTIVADHAPDGTPLTVKSLVVGGAGAAVWPLRATLARGAAASIVRVFGPSVAARGATGLVSATAGRMALTVGGRAGAAASGAVVSGVVGAALVAGLAAWDYLDHQATAEAQAPLLRQAIADHLAAHRALLLAPDGELGGALYQIETGVAAALKARAAPAGSTL